MAPASSIEEKFAFLLSCIRFSTNGSVDFKSVAQEHNITANAASKRYHRLMKEHDIHQSNSPTRNEGLSATPKSSGATPTSTPAKSGKKRKLDQLTEPRDETEDEETEQDKTKSPKKSRKTSGAGAGKKKEAIAMSVAEASDEFMLNDSSAVGGFGEPEDILKAAVKVEEHADEV